jgi:hypothetical protein
MTGRMPRILGHAGVPAAAFGYFRDFQPLIGRCATLSWKTLDGKPL